MIAKLMVNNQTTQITLPKSVLAAFEGTEGVDLSDKNGTLVLTPVQDSKGADAVRAELAKMGLNESDVADAVAWAREQMALEEAETK